MKKLFSFIFILLLVGCSSQEDIIRYPENIIFDGEYITFDPVDQATSYTLKIDSTVYELDNTSFSTSSIPNGTYEVRVKSNTTHSSSYYSPAFTLIINRIYDEPTNVMRNGMILTWNEVDNALNYIIQVNNDFIDFTHNLTYDLSSYAFDMNELFMIEVGAFYETTDIAYGNPVYYHTYQPLGLNLSASYEQDFISDFTFDFEDEVEIDAIMLNDYFIPSDEYTIIDGVLTIHAHALIGELSDVETIEILTPDGMIELVVDIIEAKPKLISSSTVNYISQMDMTFEFMLHGGSFLSLSGNEIESTDYIFSDNTLTIYSSYVESILLENPSRERIILLYQLEKNQDIIMGFIFIELI